MNNSGGGQWVFMALMLGVALVLVLKFREGRKPPEHICTQCGMPGKPAAITPGSCLVELALWIFFIIPGLIYSLWRLTSKKKVCAYCGSESMVPMASPAGQRLLKEHGEQSE